MFRPIIDHKVFTDVSWWHWAITIPLMAGYLAGYYWALALAAVLCIAVGTCFLYHLRQIRPYPVQVRIAYVGLLGIGTLPWMQWIPWMQLFGTTAMVTIGYCPLIRMLSLMPPNRTEPLTALLVWRVFARKRCTGGIIKWQADSPSAAMACCFLPAGGDHLTCSLPRPELIPKDHYHAQTY
jgi:hypothetical protein